MKIIILSILTVFENIAKYGVASQASTAYEGTAEKAVDGNKDGNYFR